MRSLTKTLGAAALAGALLVGLGACSSQAASSDSSDSAALEHVDFGYIGDFNGSSLLAIAQSQGLWKKAGLEVSTKVFTAGPLEVTALNAGSLDFGYIGPGALWLPASGKAKVIAVNTLGNADRVVALPGTGITKLSDLKGKKVAYPAGTSGEMILRLALQSAGLTLKDVDAVPLDATTIVSALTSKKVDAAGFWYPALSTVKTKIPGLVELAKDSDFADTMKFPTAFVTQETLPTKDPALVKKVLAVLKEANTYRYEHKDQAVKMTATFLKEDEATVAADAANSQLLSTDELVSDSTDGTIDDWLNTFGKYFVETGMLKEPGDASDYYTSSLYAKAGS